MNRSNGKKKSKIKLVFADIDGTLLCEGAKLPDELKQLVWKLHDIGVGFTFATGRLPYETEHLFDGIPWDYPYVAGNGTIIKDKNRVYEEHLFCPGDLKSLAEKYSSLGVTIIFSESNLERTLEVTPWARENAKVFPGLDMPIDDGVWNRRLPRMYFYHPEGRYLDACADELMELKEKYAICFQNKQSIQISPLGCTKATGIRKVAALLDITSEEILCIGDSYNDMSMIEYAGVGGAVGNACHQLKEIADIVSEECYGSGVMDIVRKIVFEIA